MSFKYFSKYAFIKYIVSFRFDCFEKFSNCSYLENLYIDQYTMTAYLELLNSKYSIRLNIGK